MQNQNMRVSTTNNSAGISNIDSDLHSLSPTQQEGQKIVNDILDVQNSADPVRFINRLPEHIVTLQRLAEQETYTSPGVISQFAKSQGFTEPLLPCNTGGSTAVRIITVLELEEQLHTLKSQAAVLNGVHERLGSDAPVLSHAKIMANGYKYVLLLAAISNIFSAGKLMLEHAPGRESRTILGLAREVVALAIHLKLFRDMSFDLSVLEKIKNTRNSTLQTLPQWDLNNPEKSLQEALAKINSIKEQSVAVTKAKDQAKDIFMKKDLPSIMAGFLTLSLAGHFVGIATQ
ncbi:hypothetical protein [Pseudomonas asuensis]|nr:hypothetical protein [Pseudomonas asuensis]